MRLAFLMALLVAAAPLARQPEAPGVDPLHRPFDQILDVNVRDGLVYYHALRQQRGALDRYVAALGAVSKATLDGWSRERQMAYWMNAYDAFVLRTVIDHYPIRGRSPAYPPNSIRQIPGAFETRTFRTAAGPLTLDQIETGPLAAFGDPRVFLGLGRGALGGGRLRSEAYTAARLEDQLAGVAAETVTRRELVYVDEADDQLSVCPIFSWRADAFSQALAGEAPARFAGRSPLERAVIAIIEPHLVNTEAEFLQKNDFRMTFHEFDWRLNDLTGR
ncbi:MAG: DUF547 domain-containing protein [Vicinamibacterales bacterium]